MPARLQPDARIPTQLLLLALACMLPGTLQGQTAATPASATQATLVDRVVAIVNGDLILESDIDEEKRFIAFEPYSDQSGFSRQQALERLIDRTLILQQAKLQPEAAVTPAQVEDELKQLRQDIPACKQYACNTAAGWAKFCAAHGFTVAQLDERWRQRMQTLRFIELRFRMGIRITPAEIKAYYDKTLLPEYVHQHATPPRLDVISDRIQEILLEQQVSALLDDWLKALRAQGSVQIMKPDEVAP
jgi:hypothetical protein